MSDDSETSQNVRAHSLILPLFSQPGGAALNFTDIAEIREVVEFLRNPGRFLEMGARSPAGVLLVGPPGAWQRRC